MLTELGIFSTNGVLLWKEYVMSGEMVTLKLWATRLTPSPHPNTLLNWAKDGKIIPAPIKLGRAYYVSKSAKHVQEVLNGSKITLS